MIDSYEVFNCSACGLTVAAPLGHTECHACKWDRIKDQISALGIGRPADKTADKHRAKVAESLGRYSKRIEG